MGRKILSIFAILGIGTFPALVIIVMLIMPYRYNKYIRRFFSKLYLMVSGTKQEFIGECDKSANILFVNHQSYIDIIIFEATQDLDLCWIAKKELGEVPIYGHMLKLPKEIFVDRENAKSLIKLIKEARNRLSHNRTLAIFPEGTRSNGKKLLPFKKGPKILAQKLNLKIQPIVIAGSKEAFNIKKMKAGGLVKIKFLDSISPNNDNWYDNLEKTMNKEYNELANSLAKRFNNR